VHPPCELMVDSFLPSMRALVARRLSDDGLSQGRIATLLGLTQASVSSYLSSPESTKQLSALSRLGVDAEEAMAYAALLAEDLKNNPTYAVATLYSIWNRILGEGDACAAHRSDYPFLATCDICMRVFGTEGGREDTAVLHLEGALRSIEGSSLFVHIMPEISVNIAYAPEGARSVEDVVAIPGRIVKVRGRARAFLRPEYGASTHLAAILLEVLRRRAGGDDEEGPARTPRRAVTVARAAINLRYDDDRMNRVLRELGVRRLTIGPDYPQGVGTNDKVLSALRARLSAQSSSSSSSSDSEEFEAVVDLGGEGVEPSLYLFAEDAITVVRRALEIARAYALLS
jgi:predicted fused transcriptional regulator/phosphomethylpyrimidine kinase/predicted transcriptional regulator